AVIDPLGLRTSIAWGANAIRAISDASGAITTMGYRTAGNGTSQLRTIKDPLGHVVTYLYDTSDRVKTTIDANAHRTSIVWNTSNQRTALIDALGNRWTTTYTAQGTVKTLK